MEREYPGKELTSGEEVGLSTEGRLKVAECL